MNNSKIPVYNYTDQLQKPWHKRLGFYLGCGALIILLLFLGPISHKIDINNKEPHGNIGSAATLPTEEDLNPMPKPDPSRTNVLILGIRGEDDLKDGGLLTDTMLLASVDSATGKATLVNIPRDLYINMLGVKGKINEAYERGVAKNQGISLSGEIISRITGVYVDKVVVFDFTAFDNIITRLDGVDITLDKPFTETQQWGYAFSLPAGLNHLNPEQALYYARSRYGSSDFDRSRRQQQIIDAVKDKAMSAGIISSPSQILGLFNDLKGHIKTNFQVWDINTVLQLAKAFSKKENVTRTIISTDNFLYQTHAESGEYILLPKSGNYKELQNYFQNIFTSPIPTSTTPPVVKK